MFAAVDRKFKHARHPHRYPSSRFVRFLNGQLSQATRYVLWRDVFHFEMTNDRHDMLCHGSTDVGLIGFFQPRIPSGHPRLEQRRHGVGMCCIGLNLKPIEQSQGLRMNACLKMASDTFHCGPGLIQIHRWPGSQGKRTQSLIDLEPPDPGCTPIGADLQHQSCAIVDAANFTQGDSTLSFDCQRLQ